ncbi:MAG: ParB/RepB/Spo0J family partition protein [Anaerolineae bacterium]|nr:ParB/RepB/Spo0J family partition protein [Anaerolineae bacterium]MDK1080616.1 ParB/RepB/Spo0J family partition protein [Anaerolineae bacterium]MDK1117590.1 ParB/RepB/Spo0J family partition protein [Anaerolineae bacterium]
MPKRPGLGKGLEALIPSTESSQQLAAGEGGVLQLSVDVISPNPRQPRSGGFDEKDLKELADSIREHGIIQPLIVSSSDGKNYTLIVGERRLRAAKQVGLLTVPAVMREVSDREFLELALIENIQRAELNPLEEAEAYRQLTEDFKLSHEEVAQRVGKSRPAVSNTMRLLQLSETVKNTLIASYAHYDEDDVDIDQQSQNKFHLSEGHARSLLSLSTHKAQDAALKTIEAGKLNVRQTEELVKRYGGDRKPPVPKKTTTPELDDLEKQLERSLETEVRLRPGKKGGTVTIRYYSDEDFEKLLKRLL